MRKIENKKKILMLIRILSLILIVGLVFAIFIPKNNQGKSKKEIAQLNSEIENLRRENNILENENGRLGNRIIVIEEERDQFAAQVTELQDSSDISVTKTYLGSSFNFYNDMYGIACLICDYSISGVSYNDFEKCILNGEINTISDMYNVEYRNDSIGVNGLVSYSEIPYTTMSDLTTQTTINFCDLEGNQVSLQTISQWNMLVLKVMSFNIETYTNQELSEMLNADYSDVATQYIKSATLTIQVYKYYTDEELSNLFLNSTFTNGSQTFTISGTGYYIVDVNGFNALFNNDWNLLSIIDNDHVRYNNEVYTRLNQTN